MSSPLLRCTLWFRRLLFFSGGRRGALSKKYDDDDGGDDDAESGGGGGMSGGYGTVGAMAPSSSFWQDAQRMIKLFVFSLLVLLIVTPDIPRWAGTSIAPAMASLACGMGGSENVALCEENFQAAVRGDFPVAAPSESSKSSDAVVDCAVTCKDEIDAAKSVNMDAGGGGGGAAAIIRGAGVSDCKPMRLNCTELEDELWSRINSLESALVASNRQIAKKDEDMDNQAELIREQQDEIGKLHVAMEKKEKDMKRYLKNSTAACIEGRRETVDLREALQQANSVLQRVEREVAAGGGAGAGAGTGGGDAGGAAAAGGGAAGGGGRQQQDPAAAAQRARERSEREKERSEREKERELREREREKQQHAHAGIYRRPPVNHGDLLELERKLDEVNKKLKVAKGGGGRP